MNIKKRILPVLLAVAMAIPSISAFSASAEWEKTDSGTKYTDKSGDYVTGWQTINNSKYYFSNDGAMKTGLLKTKTATYYFNKSGKMAINSWITLNKKKYYFGSDGKAKTGTVVIGSKQYSFDKNGVWNGKQGLLVTKYDFRQLNWGKTLQEVKEIEKDNNISKSGKAYYLTAKEKLSDYSYYVGYSFNDKTGGLEMASYTLADLNKDNSYISEFNVMYKAYEKKYGKPVEDGRVWENNSAKSVYGDNLAQAIKDGYYTMSAVWETATSYIVMFVSYSGGEMRLTIGYMATDYFEETKTNTTVSQSKI